MISGLMDLSAMPRLQCYHVVSYGTASAFALLHPVFIWTRLRQSSLPPTQPFIAALYPLHPTSFWMQLTPDGLMGCSCLIIFFTLLYLTAKLGRHFPFQWTLVGFSAFMLTCGITFFIDICNPWNPAGPIPIGVKIGLAVAAMIFAGATPRFAPRILAFIKRLPVSEKSVRELQVRAAELLAINEFLEAEAAGGGIATGNAPRAHDRVPRSSAARDLDIEATTPVGIFHSDFAGHILAVNGAWSRITGLCDEDSKNHGWHSVTHPDDLRVIEQSWAQCSELAAPFSCEMRFRSPEGAVKWAIWKTQTEFNGADEKIGYLGTVTDITERKLIEESLLRSKSEARSIHDELSFYKFALDEAVIVAVTDEAGTISFVNDKFCQISGYEREELLGQNHRMLNSRFHPKSFFTAMYAQIARGDVWRGEIRNRAKKGHFYWVDTTIIPTKGLDGCVSGYVAIRSDITERKDAEAALANERLAVEAANQALAGKNNLLSELYLTAQRFMDDVSHEFRTPLSVIKGYSELMQSGMAGPLSGDQTRFNQIIIDRARDMAQMVDDLLDSSKLRAGSLRVDRRPCTIADIFASLHPLIASRIAAAKIDWVQDIAPGLPMVFADAEKVTRVLVNLVVNAIKFSPEGSRIILSATSQDTGDVQISVTDHGAGVSPENVALIFKRFRQVGHVTGGTKGFGLGLNIAKELVALNLGQMSVASELKKGSTFSFTVPVNDPRIILARLFEHLENIHTTLGRIALLRIRPQDSGRDVTLDELRGFLACSSHAGDVIMDTSDGNALIIFGYSVNPGAWLRRLVKAGGDIQQFTPGQKLCPFAVELVDSLPYPIDLAAATSMILRYTKMETACD